MTEEDKQQVRAIVREETGAAVSAAEQRTSAAISAAVSAAEQRTSAAISAAVQESEARLTEKMRDMQSEILRGLEAFARGNFARLHRLETSDTDINVRLAALEERVLYLETRRPPAA